MSLFLSWLQKPTESYGRFTDDDGLHAQEMSSTIHADLPALPPSPASFPRRPQPPAIVRSPALRHISSPNTRSSHSRSSAQLALAQQAARLQVHLQSLLDAQADALVAGLGAADAFDTADHISASSNSHSHTPSTSRSARSPQYGPVVPVRQPTSQPMSLRAARLEIWDTMRELASIKRDEAEIFGARARHGAETVQRIKAWTAKRSMLQSDISAIEHAGEAVQVQQLREEDVALQEQIHEVEMRLAELKAQQRRVRAAVAQSDNAIQSEMSSYKASMDLVEQEVKRFLEGQPQARKHEETEAFLALPPKRRTLEMAMDHYSTEQTSSLRNLELAEQEKTALYEGADAWQDVVSRANAFERQLRRALQDLQSSSVVYSPARGRSGREQQDATSMQKILEHMDETIEHIANQLLLAETRGWKLLQCCIGAELEAFKQGRDLLHKSFGAARDEQMAAQETGESAKQNEPAVEDDAIASQRVQEYSPGGSPVTRRGQFTSRARTHTSEDDEPDPDLLISHQDTDDESSV